ncbi:hypothetical protein ACJMK2_030657 [Sinanodonta woodiana]|uniref:Uncharacterized protein n=1 Tax=Sinanodonta woodiana TaxID=1069815 RepID=A0ABD3WWY3_SINWO
MTSQLSLRRALVGRITMAAKEDGLSSYANGLPNEARYRYIQTLNSIKDYKGLSDLYKLKCGWMSDRSICPDLTFGDIYWYLISLQTKYVFESCSSFRACYCFRSVVAKLVHGQLKSYNVNQPSFNMRRVRFMFLKT